MAIPEAPPARRLRGLLLVLSGNMLLDAIEVSVAMVALPSIGGELGFTASSAQWVISGFALGFGGLLPFGGRVVGRFGRRHVYLAAMLGFALTSVLGAAAGSAVFLVVTRVLKGCCVALTAPTGLAIIGGTFPEGPARERALSVYSLFGASGFSLGLVLSGLLTGFSWRWTFLFPAPVALVLFVAGLWLVPRDGRAPTAVLRARSWMGGITGQGESRTRHPEVADLGGRAGISENERSTPSRVLATRSAGRVGQQTLSLGVLVRGTLVRSMLGAVALNGTYWGFLYLVTLHAQGPLGWSPLRTGLAILPASLLLTLAVPFSGRMVRAAGPARLIALGAIAPPLGYFLYFLLGAPSILYSMVAVGVGYALSFSALHVQAVSGLPDSDRQPATALYQASVQLGGAAVLAGAAAAPVVVLVVGVLGFLVAATGVVSQRMRRKQ
jgi:MFS family permease